MGIYAHVWQLVMETRASLLCTLSLSLSLSLIYLAGYIRFIVCVHTIIIKFYYNHIHLSFQK